MAGGRREGSGRKRLPASVHKFEGTYRRSEHERPLAAPLKARQTALKRREGIIDGLLDQLESKIEAGAADRAVVREYRNLLDVQLRVGGRLDLYRQRDVENTPPAPSPFDEFLASTNPTKEPV
jgi:hypothetical protein